MGYILKNYSNIKLIYSIKPAISIGRRTSNDFIVDDESVSRKHIIVSSGGDNDYVTNRGSEIFLNSESITDQNPRILRKNDKIFLKNESFDYINNTTFELKKKKKPTGMIIVDNFCKINYRKFLSTESFTFQILDRSDHIKNLSFILNKLLSVRSLNQKYIKSINQLIFYFAYILPNKHKEQEDFILVSFNLKPSANYISIELPYNNTKRPKIKFQKENIELLLSNETVENNIQIEIIDNRRIVIILPSCTLKIDHAQLSKQTTILDMKFCKNKMQSQHHSILEYQETIKQLNRQFQDRYSITEYIGEGGMGRVFRAKSIKEDYSVAIKIIHPNFTRDKTIQKRLQREAKALKAIDNPRVPKMYESGVVNEHVNQFYIVMEYVNALPLNYFEKFITQNDIKFILRDICHILYSAHAKGIIHRDLKPENILVRPFLSGFDIKIIDFGISKILSQSENWTDLTDGLPLGTMNYMAPEVFDSEKEPTQKIDIYSLGVLVYKLIAKKLPIEEKSKPKFMKRLLIDDIPISYDPIPQEFKGILSSMLQRNPEDRPDILQIISQLDHINSDK